MDCLCATDAAEEELLSIAQAVRESAERFRGQPEMENRPGVAEASLAGGMETFLDRSPVVGRPLAAMLAHDGAKVWSFDIDSVMEINLTLLDYRSGGILRFFEILTRSKVFEIC